MRHPMIGIALVALTALSAGAQTGSGMMAPGTAHAMKTPCPMHLETLALTPAQQLSVDSIRADHEALMKSMMASHMSKRAGAKPMVMSDADKAMMRSTMHLTAAAMHSVLDPTQRQTFDAAMKAHEAEMATKGAQGCADCYKACMDHMSHHAAMKHEG